MDLIDIVEQIEECGKLITQNNPNKDILALIMIDSVYDMYVIDFFNNIEKDNKDSLDFYTNFKEKQEDLRTTTGLSNMAIQYWTEAKAKYDNILNIKSHYENRLNHLVAKDYITKEECETVKALHKFRNVFLHQSSRQNLYLKPLTILYYKLLNNLFISITKNSYSLRNSKCKYIKSPERISNNHFENIIYTMNKELSISFNIDEIKKLLQDFLFKEIEKIEENIFFILNCFVDKKAMIKKLSTEFNLKKCLSVNIDDDDIRDIEFEKIKKLKGRIQRLKSFKSFDTLINAFRQLFEEINLLYSPINNEACLVDQYIELQAEILRGK